MAAAPLRPRPVRPVVAPESPSQPPGRARQPAAATGAPAPFPGGWRRGGSQGDPHDQGVLPTPGRRVVILAPADGLEADLPVQGTGGRVARPYLQEHLVGAGLTGPIEEEGQEGAPHATLLMGGCDRDVEKVSFVQDHHQYSVANGYRVFQGQPAAITGLQGIGEVAGAPGSEVQLLLPGGHPGNVGSEHGPKGKIPPLPPRAKRSAVVSATLSRT